MTAKPDLLSRFRIVLSHTSHPGNIGATARAMKVMGLSDLHLVNPAKFPHPEAVSLAAGADDILDSAVVCQDLAEALQGCILAVGLSARKRNLSHSLVTVRQAAEQATELLRAETSNAEGRIALVFGTEMSGLSNAELDMCQQLAMIPANPGYSSLNVAAAVQVVCYELRMAVLEEALRPIPQREAPELATLDEVEHFYGHLEQTLVEIGFLNPYSPKRLMQRLRRLYARARLEKEEVNILRGILTLTQKPRKADWNS